MVIANHVNVRPAGGGRLMVWVGDVDEAVQRDGAWLGERSQRAAELAEVAMRAGREYVPALRRAAIEKAAVCLRALPADGLPVVGWVPDVDGLYVIAAHAAVSLAPAVADIACAELVELREDPRLDDFRPTRFARGGRGPSWRTR
jgi:glycine/D-amino acid oxidase-like deaminating enzyme